MHKEEIIQKAEAFCKEHRVNRFPVNVITLCEQCGITVFGHMLPPAVSGFIVIQEEPFQDFGTGHLIVMNSCDSAGRQRFTIAHELAHYVLHREGNEPIYAHRDAGQNDGIEREANIFASNLLMPTALMEKFLRGLDGYPQSVLADQVASAFAVSHEAALVRLDQLGLIGG
ncbi:MAG: ImmA/IrrE family metallo-endopeptidase [Oscillospiraceae bacterium]|nr:ImmA/IrrE family metallo-endopeptidase [Oscillospiraceae bacterium]